uniref:Uncharacterized protein n=1 Tax=Hapterophycus canaliculatus TaxID=2567908 RepID=A0A5A4NB83_9PHAE|nr:hypothetical protein Scana_132 [Hapterophycus canaliculatus]AYP10076.1 hypothetical protein Scana_132 [Hapterophycus canaliculatus]
MKLLEKRNKILEVFKFIKNLDPFFFELLMDSIRDSNKTPIVKNKPKALFIIYSNIFTTKKLNIPLIKEKTLDLETNKVNNKITVLDLRKRSIIKLESSDKELDLQLKKNLFYNLYLSRYNELLTSQVLRNVKRIQSFDKI